MLRVRFSYPAPNLKMFLFRKPKVVVDCFTSLPMIYDLFKIDYVSKFIPKEWKSMPAQIDVKPLEHPYSNLTTPVPTIKRCIGAANQFSTGFVIPMWADLVVEIFPDGTFVKHDPSGGTMVYADSLPRHLYWDSLYEDYGHIKISNPWLIREKTGIHFAWNQWDWSGTDKLSDSHVLSGIIDFQAQHGSHINIFQKKGTIVRHSAGDPMVHVIPITEKKLELKCHLVDDNEYKKLYKSYADRLMFIGQHRTLLKARQKEQSKCPFSKMFGS